MRPMAEVGSRSERQRLILDHVMEKGQASAPELIALTGRSLTTVHRDLDDLARRRLVRRFHGGVSALPTSAFESSSEFRLQHREAEKDALAVAALAFIEPGMSIVLDDSTTVLALAALLPLRAPLNVASNYRQVLKVLRDSVGIRLRVIGGLYSRTRDSFGGLPDDTRYMSHMADIVFQSASAMDARMTYYHEQDVVSMNRKMVRGGRRRVLMMDGSKVGRTSLHRFLPVDAFTDVLLTADVHPVLAAQIGERTKVEVVRAGDARS